MSQSKADIRGWQRRGRHDDDVHGQHRHCRAQPPCGASDLCHVAQDSRYSHDSLWHRSDYPRDAGARLDACCHGLDALTPTAHNPRIQSCIGPVCPRPYPHASERARVAAGNKSAPCQTSAFCAHPSWVGTLVLVLLPIHTRPFHVACAQLCLVWYYRHPDRAIAMTTAVEIASSLRSFDTTWPHHVHFQVAVTGGVATSSIYRGLLVDLSELCDDVQWPPHPTHFSFSSHQVVLVQGDIAFSLAACRQLESAALILTTGAICAQTLDWCRHRPIGHAMLCVPYQPLAVLRRVASTFAVRVCERLCEAIVLVAVVPSPCSPSTEAMCIQATIERLHCRTFLQLQHHTTTPPPSCSPSPPPSSTLSTTPLTVLVTGMSRATADDATANITNALHRLAHAVEDEVVLPGGGASMAACASALRRRPIPSQDEEIEDDSSMMERIQVIHRFGDALDEWCALVLGNAPEHGGGNDFLDIQTKLGDIQTAFDQGNVEPKFLETTYYGAALTPLVPPRGTFKFDGFRSTKAALTSAVRVVTLATNVGVVLINQS
ncbi:hypothetical protein, variant 1 [Aphanomyces astaci]|uniref:Uncharacterized protein n=1 Tax=Aphanomyces astaci TaxID=112090 RepID=W4GAH5_APHAT|nr:hypothetical protein, variant 1 [Aphanomyces astaci]ETV76665.1 hypothetical protein, variant 1 [Aphanomyces astaci]|eukprot:XP_009833576.1 hypothetical protein, variant 1 [Aphanomyces astaci]